MPAGSIRHRDFSESNFLFVVSGKFNNPFTNSKARVSKLAECVLSRPYIEKKLSVLV